MYYVTVNTCNNAVVKVAHVSVGDGNNLLVELIDYIFSVSKAGQKPLYVGHDLILATICIEVFLIPIVLQIL